MEIQQLLDSKTLVPVTDLASIATNRNAFGDDVINAYSRQAELRAAAVQAVLTEAETAGRDSLLASEQRSYDTHNREQHAVLALQQTIEQRTAAKGYVPATQGGTAKPETRGGLFGTGIELRALATTSGAGAVVSPDQFGPGFFDRLKPRSVMLASGIQILRTERDTIHMPRVDTDPAVVFVAEGVVITPSDPGYTDIVASPVKMATITVISNELAADSSPDITQLIEMQILRALALKFDLAAFTANETNFKGLQYVTGITLDSSLGAAGTLPPNLDVIAGAIGTLEAEGAHANAIYMHPRTWASLLKMKEVSGSTKSLMSDASTAAARMIFGVPVYLSSQLSITETKGASTDASSIYVVDTTQIYGVFRTDARVEVDHSRLFNSDQSEIRGIMRATLAVPNPKAIVRIEGVRTVT